MTKENLVKGTIILTLASMLSKVMGFIYVIPFTAMVGAKGFVLFEYSYKPYVVLLVLTTMGIPLGVSKLISKYNGMGRTDIGIRLLYSGMLFLGAAGAIMFGMLYAAAPYIARMVINPHDQTGNSLKNVIYVIRMLSFALLIVPPMAIVRGFFQGQQYMQPTAVSQMVEQIVRVLVVVAGTFILLHVWKTSIVTAVGVATLGTVIGALASCVTLYGYYKKNPLYFQMDTKSPNVSYRSLYKELLSYALPFAIVSLAVPMYQLADTFTINQGMMARGATQGGAETVNALIGLVQKVIMIPVSLATGFAYTLVPAITASYTSKQQPLLHEQMKQTYQSILLITLPAVCGLFSIASVSFGAMFGKTHAVEGGWYLAWYAPTGMLFSLFIVTAAMMQGVNEHRQAMYSFFAGIALKCAFNYWMVKEMGGNGSTVATEIGFMVSIFWNVWILRERTGFSLMQLKKDVAQVTGACAVMMLVVFGINRWTGSVVGYSYISYVVRMGIAMAFGGGVYAAFMYRSPAFQMLFGRVFRKRKGRAQA